MDLREVFIKELIKESAIVTPRISIRGAKGFTASRIAKAIPIERMPSATKPIMTKGLARKLKTLEGKSQIGSKKSLGIGKPELLGRMIYKKLRRR